MLNLILQIESLGLLTYVLFTRSRERHILFAVFTMTGHTGKEKILEIFSNFPFPNEQYIAFSLHINYTTQYMNEGL